MKRQKRPMMKRLKIITFLKNSMEFPTSEAPKKIKPVKTESQLAEARESEIKRRHDVLVRYMEKILANPGVDEAEEAGIKEYYKSKSVREQTEALYDKVMAYDEDEMEWKRQQRLKKNVKIGKNDRDILVKGKSRKTGRVEEKRVNVKGVVAYAYPDKAPEATLPRLVSEIKTLYGDPAVRELFLTSYAEAGTDAKRVRGSELNIKWNKIRDEIDNKEADYKKLAQDMHLGKIVGAGKISSAKTRLAMLAESLINLDERRRQIETLQNVPQVETNTDVIAGLQYEKLLEYKKQMIKGFVKLPSRLIIDRKIISALLNHRWPLLLGEAGTGKSEQADEAAFTLTGFLPTKVACSVNTSDFDLIKDIALDKDGAKFDEYAALMQAFTGYDNSLQDEPTHKSGRLCRFDEANRLGSKPISTVKEAKQAKPGSYYHGRKVLHGAGAILTANPVGQRYKDRNEFDPAMRRELAEIQVPYVDMSPNSPELYEFALVALLTYAESMDVAKQELKPAYEKIDFPADQQITLADGSVVKAKDEIISDMADAKHGALWRFCGAIHALQDSFVYGNAQTEKFPDTILRYKENDHGELYITKDGSGTVLTLSSATVTLGELRSWMEGFNDRRGKRDKDFHGNTLTEWLDFKIKTYMGAVGAEDREKLVALFKHFHFLEGAVPNVANAKPLTAKEIGYLSPRVPRPLYVEKPLEKTAESPLPAEPPPPPNIPYVSKDVVMDDDKGSRMTITEESFDLD